MNKKLVILVLFMSLLFETNDQQAEVYIFRPKAYISSVLNIQVSMGGQIIGRLGFLERLVYQLHCLEIFVLFQKTNKKKP